MIGALSVMKKKPCAISVVNGGGGPDLIIVEPLFFIPASDVRKLVARILKARK